MNELHDEDVIARLRSALDELTAEHDRLVAVEAPQPRVSAGRWMAVAAAIVLIAGAVTAIAINRANGPDAASSPTVLPPTVPVATAPSPADFWYILGAQDLAPEPVEFSPCCSSVPPPGPNTVMAWAATTGFADGVLLLLSQPTINGDPVLKYMSYGLTEARAAELQARVVPGSGQPYVLPDDGMELVGFGIDGMGAQRSQRYSNGLGAVTITVGDYRGQLTPLVLGGGFNAVDIAGWRGYRYDDEAGNVHVVWRTPAGSWASLEITSSIADRADGLIAAVHAQTVEGSPATADTVLAPAEPTSELTIAGDTLPPFDVTTGTDPAVGMPAPQVNGFDYEGNDIRIDPAEGPHLVMFQAHWCPHCAANLPNVMTWMADGTIPSWLPVTLVSTAESSTSANYLADKWLQENDWTGRVLHDPNDDSSAAGEVARAYGTSGYPFFVVIGVDGNVLARASGELTKHDMEQLLAALPAGPKSLGRLEIPAIGVDWSVVDNSLNLAGSARLGPVFLGDTLPTELPIGGSGDGYTMIYGNRTAYGAPFLKLEQLVVGDTFTWTDGTGTATFKVTSTDACAGADTCSTIAGSLLLTTSDPLFTDQEALFVFARRVS